VHSHFLIKTANCQFWNSIKEWCSQVEKRVDGDVWNEGTIVNWCSLPTRCISFWSENELQKGMIMNLWFLYRFILLVFISIVHIFIVAINCVFNKTEAAVSLFRPCFLRATLSSVWLYVIIISMYTLCF